MEKAQINNLIKIAEAVKNLPFGESPALPWCRESFPELDAAMKEYEGIRRNITNHWIRPILPIRHQDRVGRLIKALGDL